MKTLGSPTRFDIWKHLGGNPVRDDSAEADVFNCLIMDLSFGHVIRIAREKSPDGRFYKRERSRGENSPYMKSALDNEQPLELTAVGEKFIHYTMK